MWSVGRPSAMPAEYADGADEVHALRNQSEFPRISRWARFSNLLRGRGVAEGVGARGTSPIPYHNERGSYMGVFRAAYRYPLSPQIGGFAGYKDDMSYEGEAFLRMQPGVRIAHPSGLLDTASLSGEQLAEVMRGGS